MKKINIPPFAQLVVRSGGPFVVYQSHDIIGPNQETDRVFTYRTARDPVEIEVDSKEKLTTRLSLRASSYEQNDGIGTVVQADISEPTIQEMMEMYLRKYVETAEDEPETPDEFFDFGPEEEDEEPYLSQYQVMEEQYPNHPEEKSSQNPPGESPGESPQGESPDPDPEPESEKIDNTSPAD